MSPIVLYISSCLIGGGGIYTLAYGIFTIIEATKRAIIYIITGLTLLFICDLLHDLLIISTK